MPVYAFGSNGNGQLGVGHVNDLFTPQPCQLDIQDLDIAKIAAGGNHSAILTIHGDIYFSGDNSHGQCGDVTSTNYQRSTALSSSKWKDVACGWSFTILVEDVSGQVYVMGEGSRGELGHGDSLCRTSIAVAIKGVDQVASIACGWRHALAVKVDGSVVGWGSGSYGQLGINGLPAKNSKATLPITVLATDIVNVACGQMHSVFLDIHGRVFTMGLNKHGQLGMEPPTKCLKSSIPSLIELPAPVDKISCGWHHTLVLTRDGELWGWGRSDHGQLTNMYATGDNWIDVPVRLSWKPVRLQQSSTTEAMICGSEHVLTISGGQAYAWGWNEHGNCTSTDADVLAPRSISLGKPRMIAAGCGTSWIITV